MAYGLAKGFSWVRWIYLEWLGHKDENEKERENNFQIQLYRSHIELMRQLT